MNQVFNRLYSDYFMPSRLRQYNALVLEAKNAGYWQTSVRTYFKSRGKTTGSGKKIIVHRHDIDTDVRTARKIFNIEKKHGIQSSFYFRLATLDFDFMREIEAYGSEASYHYEEIADFAKKNHIKSADEIRGRLAEIREQFFSNYDYIEKKLGTKLETVASHGDFANRRLNVINRELLNDQKLRARCGIACESYDAALLDSFDIYISDRPHPQYYHPISPFSAIDRYQRICFLTHPVQWETNWIESTKHNVRRLVDELKW